MKDESANSVTPAALYRKDDCVRFSRNKDGSYSMDESRMDNPYKYTYAKLMETGAFTSVHPLVAITKQRDELLAALKRAIALIDQHDKRGFLTHPFHTDLMPARTAIAKATAV